MRKKNIIALGLLTTAALTLLINQKLIGSRFRLVVDRGPPRPTATCGDHVTRANCKVGDSAMFYQREKRREVCGRMLRLGLLVIPDELQKECEAIAEESPDWLELFKRFLSYVRWHRGVYLQISNNQTTLQETRTLTYNCDIFNKCTGLGATVKSIATGVLAAMYTKRFFIADQLSFHAASCWTDLAILPNLIHWKLEAPTWESFEDKVSVTSHVVKAALNASNLHVFYGHPSIGHKEFFCKDLPEVERNSVTAILCKECLKRNADEFALGRKYTHFLFGAITRAAMHFSKAVSEQTNQKLILLQKEGLPSSGYLAVHLRTGVNELYAGHMNLAKYLESGKFILGYANWAQHIDCALQKANDSGVGRPILLVTDSNACREWTKAHYKPEDVLVTNSSFFHFSKVAHRKQSCDMQKTLQLNDMVSEMDLLSRASTLIPSAMSSFSEVAFYLSALPQSQLRQC